MLQLALPPASMLNMLKNMDDLERGAMHHTRWLKGLHRTLICEGDHSSHADLLTDAHCRCDFGRWYYGEGHEELNKLELFLEIGHRHELMHNLARKILLKKATADSVCSLDYEAFIETAIDFKAAIRKLQNSIIENVCVFDHLTGCYNRQSMAIKLAQEHERVNRHGGCCAIAMIDVDHFKRINDSYGHAIGDEVLRGIAERFCTQLRSYDSLFRYGGEEFLACMPENDHGCALELMERLRLDLVEHPLKLRDGTEIAITASFGVSSLTPGKGLDDTLVQADEALLYAKANGRNCVHRWGSA